jgi:hypothetical protein
MLRYSRAYVTACLHDARCSFGFLIMTYARASPHMAESKFVGSAQERLRIYTAQAQGLEVREYVCMVSYSCFV